MQKQLNFLSGLNIQKKLFLIPLLMIVPILFLAWKYIGEKRADIQFAEKEQLGTEYIAPIKSLARNLARHRDLTMAIMRGATAAQGLRAEAVTAVETDLNVASELDQRVATGGGTYGAALETSSRFNAIRQKWGSLKNRNTSAGAVEVFNEHSQLIGEILDLVVQAADKSNLTLDPDADSYYLMDAAVTQIPNLQEQISQLRGIASGSAAAKSLTADERGQLFAQTKLIENDLAGFKRAFDKALASNEALRQSHAGKADVQAKDVQEYVNSVRSKVLSGTEINADPMQLFTAGTQTSDRLRQLDEAGLADLRGLLDQRISRLSREFYQALAVASLFILLAALFAYWVTRNITDQTGDITKLIGAVESGDFGQRATVLSNDELGRTARAFNEMLDNTKGLMQSRDERDRIQASIMKLLDEVANVADGDLTAEAEVTEDMTGAIADAFNFMIVNLRELIGKVKEVSYQVTQTTSDTAHFAERLAQGSQEQAERIAQTSTALSEMAAQIVRVSQSADSSAQVADASLSTARKGSEAVQDTVEGMTRIQEQVQESSRRIRQLNERSQEIEEIVRLIEEIADRTGVLALNASIQAAAAGEAGYGFTVVATEVEQLAGRAQEATKRIGSLIRAIQSGTNEAMLSMEEVRREVVNGARVAQSAGESLHEIESVSNQLAGLVRSISHATQQQARGSEALAQTMTQLAQLTNQTTTGVLQSTLTVKNLASLANDLRASVETFKVAENEATELQMSGSLPVTSDALWAAAGQPQR